MSLDPAQSLEVTTEMVGAAQVVRVSGRLDTTTVEAFDAQMLGITSVDGARLALDLAHVSYVSSAGLRSLLMILKQLKAHGGRLVLAALHPRVKDILEIAGFTTMFTITPSVDVAVATLQSN